MEEARYLEVANYELEAHAMSWSDACTAAGFLL